MSKVLIIGPNFYNFNTAVKNAFENLGWQVIVEGYDNPVHPYNWWMKIWYKLSYKKNALREKARRRFSLYIKDIFATVNPDLVFIMNADMLHHDTLNFFRKTSIVACWLFDRVANIPFTSLNINYVDYLFCYDNDDVEILKQQGKTAYFLPQACDDRIYFPINSLSKDIDILFVGNLYYSQRRIEYVKTIVSAFPDTTIRVIGEYKPWYKNPIKCLFREHKNIFTNKNIPEIEVNSYYNRAKVVLNIHNEQQENGANPKVFEISGSGAYQICDANQFIENLFQKEEIGLYHTKKEMVDLILDALEHNKSENAQRAYQVVISKHTFNKRIEQMLGTVYN